MFGPVRYSGLLIILFTIFAVRPSFAQPSIEKNDYVSYDVNVSSDSYEITYRFKDQFYNLQTYSLSMPLEETNNMIDKFGIPNWLFEPYVDNPANRYYREQEMAKGLFLLNENTIEVDKSAVLDYYSSTFAEPIARMIVSSLADYGRDTRRDRIEFAMRFIQDIPYGVPDYKDDERHYGGVHSPPQLLIKGYGDCDSKVLLFAGILTYLIPASDIIFLNQKEHVLSAIREEPDKGLTFVSFGDEQFLIAETAGPGKRLLGEKGHYYRERFTIETLRIDPPEILPFAKPSDQTIMPGPLGRVDDNTLLIKNGSSRSFQFQISPDNRRWENLNLPSQQAGEYVFEKKVKLFLRFKETRNKTATYQITTGSAYTIRWNTRRNRWEISNRSM